MDSEKRPVTTGVLVSFASLVVIIAGLKAASPIVIPLLVAGFIALILSPPLFYLQRTGLPTWAALSNIFNRYAEQQSQCRQHKDKANDNNAQRGPCR